MVTIKLGNCQIYRFQIMINQDGSKRKLKTKPNNYNNTSTSLLAMRDYRKQTVSREKSNNACDAYPKDYESTQAKPPNFKVMNDKPHSHERHGKVKLSDHKPKNIKMIPMHENPHGISINVNIHNVISPKNAGREISDPQTHTPKLEKTFSGLEGRKSRRISKLRPDADDFDFMCNEELSYQKHNKYESNKKIGVVERQPLIDKTKCQPKKKVHKEKQVEYKEVLKKFDAEAAAIEEKQRYESILYLDNRQHNYMVQPSYIERKQKNFTWVMRAVLVEWMMQVCYQFSLKRQTFYIAVNLVDRFLEKENHLAKSDFQLVGASAMFIASKLEEYEPRSSQKFAESANGQYSVKQIQQMQQLICMTLKYELNPPTFYRWGNLLMAQWDSYLKNHIYAKQHPIFACKGFFYFKQLDEHSYMHFRLLFQLLDCSILEIQTYEYNPKLLVCSLMYLLIAKQMQIFPISEIPKFQSRSDYLIDEDNLFNDLFENFLQFTFGIKLRQLLPIVQYCSTFFNLPPNMEQPVIPYAQGAGNNMQLEEYCSFQTFDKNMLIFVKKRFRGICID